MRGAGEGLEGPSLLTLPECLQSAWPANRCLGDAWGMGGEECVMNEANKNLCPVERPDGTVGEDVLQKVALELTLRGEDMFLFPFEEQKESAQSEGRKEPEDSRN